MLRGASKLLGVGDDPLRDRHLIERDCVQSDRMIRAGVIGFDAV
jgi:hypothetical protein